MNPSPSLRATVVTADELAAAGTPHPVSLPTSLLYRLDGLNLRMEHTRLLGGSGSWRVVHDADPRRPAVHGPRRRLAWDGSEVEQLRPFAPAAVLKLLQDGCAPLVVSPADQDGGPVQWRSLDYAASWRGEAGCRVWSAVFWFGMWIFAAVLLAGLIGKLGVTVLVVLLFFQCRKEDRWGTTLRLGEPAGRAFPVATFRLPPPVLAVPDFRPPPVPVEPASGSAAAGLPGEFVGSTLPARVDLNEGEAQTLRGEFKIVLTAPGHLTTDVAHASLRPTGELPPGTHQVILTVEEVAPKSLVFGHVALVGANGQVVMPVCGHVGRFDAAEQGAEATASEPVKPRRIRRKTSLRKAASL